MPDVKWFAMNLDDALKGMREARGFNPGDVLCLRKSGHVFDVARSADEAMKIIEPMARANRGEKFYTAVVTAVISEPLPPLSVEVIDTTNQVAANGYEEKQKSVDSI